MTQPTFQPSPATGPGRPQTLAYAGTHTLPVYDNGKRARMAIKSMRAFAIVYAVALLGGAGFAVYNYATGAALGEFSDELTVPLITVGVIAFVAFLALIFAVVYYMMWQFRAYWNVRAVGTQTRYTPGWSVGWWFIPFCNLFVPKRILNELWAVSGALQTTGDPSRPDWIYGLWVGQFLLAVASAVLDVTFQFTASEVAGWGSVLFDIASGAAMLAFVWLLAGYASVVQEHQPAPTVGP